MKNKKILIILGATFVGGSLAAYGFWKFRTANSDPALSGKGIAGVEGPAGGDLDVIAIDTEDSSSGNGTQQDPSTQRPPAPDLNRPAIFPPEMESERRAAAEKQINDLKVALRGDSGALSSWIELGLLWKSIGDYEGARQAWEYASVIRPKNFLSFRNLGVLYGYYLNEPAKAEKNFLQAIENDPNMTEGYQLLADFYVEVLQNRDKALAFLRQSVTKNPTNTELREFSERF